MAFKKHLLLAACSFFFIISNSFPQSVDPLTGRAVISIPLVEVSALDLSVSVSLSHHGGALRLNESPGNAGMGWNVAMGSGYVSREIRGLPDDYDVASDNRKGWLFNSNAQNAQSFTSTTDDNLGVCTDDVNDWNFINNLGYVRDAEPDIYHFRAPGIAGKFVYGADGLPKLIPYQDLQISSAGGGFTIKTNTGIIYTFGASERVTRQSYQYNGANILFFKSNYFYYETPLTYTSTWNLENIRSTASGALASYSYTPGEQDYNSSYFTFVRPSDSTRADTLFYLKETISPMLLNQVTLKNYSISLSWANSLIDKVTTTETETGESKEFDFVYKSIKSSLDNGPFAAASRPFLMEVKQQNSCNAYPSYLFHYTLVDTVENLAPIPWHTGWGEDHFGYYNGQTSNENIPTVYFYASESGARRYRVTPIPNTTATDIFAGGDRNVNSLYTKFAAIDRIHYPSGGVTEINYQANKYWDASTGEELFGPGLRVTSITTTGGDYAFGRPLGPGAASYHGLTKSYQYTNEGGTTTSGKILYPPVFAFTDGNSVYRSLSDLGPGSEVLYSCVKESITGQGYRVYKYDIPNVYPDVPPVATKGKVARAEGAACATGLLKNGPYTWPFAPVTDLDFKRGFLTNLSEFTETGVLTREKRLVYSTPQAISSISGLRFEAITDAQNYDNFHYSVYEIPVNQSRILTKEIVKQISEESQADSIKVTTAYAYNTKNMVVQTTQTNADNSAVNHYIRYSGDYAITSPASGDLQANALFKLNTNNRTGEVVETYKTFTPAGGSAVVTGAQLNLLKDYGTYVWPYQTKHFPQGLSFTASSASGESSQSFISDTAYLLDATFDYANGLPVNQTGTSLTPVGTHYSSGTSLPLATFVNCKAENAVYDGFELSTSRDLTGGSASAPGWTGKNSLLLDDTFTLNSTSTTKSENIYRISFWAFASTSNINVTIKAKDGTTVQSTLTLNYSTANQWSYLDEFIDMSAVSPSFVIEVSSSAPIRIDDFIALPKSARATLKTYLPLTGITSQADDLGNSTVITYDVMGRQVNTLDRNRNLVELKEYGLQKQGKVALNANFTSNVTEYALDEVITFTAASTCISGVSYQWTFTTPYGSETSASGSPANNTFSLIGEHTVKLTVTAPGYGTQSYAESACVVLSNNTDIGISVSPSATIYSCDPNDNRQRVFSASVPGINPRGTGPEVAYTWYITDINGQWVNALVVSGASVDDEILTYQSPAYSYQVKCEARYTSEQSIACGYNTFVGDGIEGVSFIEERQCE
jgi:hypothetical protein